MLFFYFSAVCLLFGSLASARICARAACNADNCARAAYGTAGGLASTRLAACSSFFSFTVDGATKTTTVTVTESTNADPITASTVTVFNGGVTTQVSLSVQRAQSQSFNIPTDASVTPTAVAVTATGVPFFPHGNVARSIARQDTSAISTTSQPQPIAVISPSAVPSWASACSGTARYSSACSCAGIRATTITGGVSTVTQTVTISSQPTAQPARTVTISQTPTTTAVLALQPTGYACNSTVQVNQGCNCFYQIACGRREIAGEVFSNSTVPTEVDCLNVCDTTAKCNFANYNFITGACSLITREGAPRDPIVVEDANEDTLLAEAQFCQNDIESGLCH